MRKPNLTLLYVPGDRPDLAEKALKSEANGIILDLEDAVAPDHKAQARAQVKEIACEIVASKSLQVRINAPTTPWGSADVEMVSALPVEVGMRLPKAEDVDELAEMIRRGEGRRVHLLIESALGIERAFDLARVHGVGSIGLGEADLRADLGLTSPDGLVWARSRLVNAARAAGLPSPLMAAFTNVKDEAALAESCRKARAIGFLGGVAIHPRQLPIIRQAFRPSAVELALAQEIVERSRSATGAGVGALQLEDGSFLDKAVVRNAKYLMALEEAASAID